MTFLDRFSPAGAHTATAVPRPEYPRPQMARDRWLNLNGTWQFEIDRGDSGLERGLVERAAPGATIIVPFAPESRALRHRATPTSWRRSGTAARSSVPAEWAGGTTACCCTSAPSTMTRRCGSTASRSCGTAAGSPPFTADITAHREPGGHGHDRRPGPGHRATAPQARGKQSRPLREPRLRLHADHRDLADGVAGAGAASAPAPAAHHARRRPARHSTSWLPLSREPARPHGRPSRSTDADGERRDRRPRAPTSTWRPRCALVAPRGPRPHLGRPATRTCTASTRAARRGRRRRRLRASQLRRPALGHHRRAGDPDQRRARLPAARARPGLLARVAHDRADGRGAASATSSSASAAGFNGARLHQKVFEERYLFHADRLGLPGLGRVRRLGRARLRRRPPTASSRRRRSSPQWLEALQRDSHPPVASSAGARSTRPTRSCTTASRSSTTSPGRCGSPPRLADPTRPVLDASRLLAPGARDRRLGLAPDYEQDPARFAANRRRPRRGAALRERARQRHARSRCRTPASRTSSASSAASGGTRRRRDRSGQTARLLGLRPAGRATRRSSTPGSRV